MLYKLILLMILFISYTCNFNSQQDKYRIELKEILIINNDYIGKINDIQVDSKGQIYISDGISSYIYLYNSKGQMIKKFGGKGDAPGEYMYIWGMQLKENDTLVVYDGFKYRLTIYAPYKFNSPNRTINISPLKNKPFKPGAIGSGYSGMSGLWVTNNKNMPYLIIFTSYYSEENLSQKKFSLLYKLDEKGRIINENPILKVNDVERLIIASGSSFRVSEMPFGSKPIIKLSQDGLIYYGDAKDFMIKSFDLNGYKLNEIKYKIDKHFITDKMWEDELRNYFPLSLKDVKKSKTPLPEYLPVFEDFTIDDNGNIWVAANQKDFKGFKYYIFDKNGKLLNTVVIPNKTVIKLVKNDYAYGIRTDNKGVQSVVKYQVKKINK